MICSKCKQDKPVHRFAVNSSSKTGRRSECKECQQAGWSKEDRRMKDKQAALDQIARAEEIRKVLNIAGPRNYVTTEVWIPRDNSYYRNDGNKHIQSRGV